jgi:hypothetical protein
MKTGYQCDNCLGWTTARNWIFHCIECGKEICDSCMYGWTTCKECASKHGKGKDKDAFLSKRFEEME